MLFACGLMATGACGPTPPSGGLIAERLPRVVHRGGPFLRAPEVTTVSFTGHAPAEVASLQRFGDTITRSPWWREAVDTYCVGEHDCIGEGRAGRHVHLDRALPSELRDLEVERLLHEETRDGGTLAGLDAQALVLVFLPPGVALGDARSPCYCGEGPRAYHRMLRTEGASFAYAVVPHCGPEAELTATASHELLEATTNPDPQAPGFRLEPGARAAPFSAAGAEPADPCGLLALDGRASTEGDFAVERAWSNRAAALGSDPCGPASSDAPYLALTARTPTVRLGAVGDIATILLDAASTGTVDGWDVAARDLTGQREGERYVEAALDRQVVHPGDVVLLTVRLLKVPPQRRTIVGVVSTRGAHAYAWPVAVSTR